MPQFMGILSSGDQVRFLPQLRDTFTSGYLKLSAPGEEPLRLTPHILRQVGQDAGQLKFGSWGCKELSWFKSELLHQVLERARHPRSVKVEKMGISGPEFVPPPPQESHRITANLSHAFAHLNLHRTFPAESGYLLQPSTQLDTFSAELPPVDQLLFREFPAYAPRVTLGRTYAYAASLNFVDLLPRYNTVETSVLVSSVTGTDHPAPRVSRVPELHEARLRGLTPVPSFEVQRWTAVWGQDIVGFVHLPTEEWKPSSAFILNRHELAGEIDFDPPFPFNPVPSNY